MSRTKCSNRIFLFAVVALFFQCALLHAVIKPSKMFSSDMVLQRNMPVPVWGWADKGEKVTVKFNGQTKSATTDANGKWMVHLDPMKACRKSQKMVISGNNTITFGNVLVGEVWLCSGQSNMAMEVRNCLNGKEEITNSKTPDIRLKLIFRAFKKTPVKDPHSRKWVVSSPKTAGKFSAVAYFFARELNKELDVPIGLISSSVGGTRIEPWTAPEGFRLVPELKTISSQVDEWHPVTKVGAMKHKEFINKIKIWLPKAEQALAMKQKMPTIPVPPEPEIKGRISTTPTTLYNGMIAPLIPYAIRGVIWYQGEANGGEGLSYFHKMQALIKGWRQLWNQGNFPFYFVQLPNYKSIPRYPRMGGGWCKTREAQAKSLEIPNTGMVVTIDIGETRNIHPQNKQDVGKRLAKWALAKDYGKNVVCSGPLYKKAKVEGNKIRIYFDHVGSGLMIGEKIGMKPVKEIHGEKLKWVSICGADQVWHWADAEIDGDTMLVSSNKVSKPVAVRYAYAFNPEGCNLYNKAGLPASPFRTDNFLK